MQTGTALILLAVAGGLYFFWWKPKQEEKEAKEAAVGVATAVAETAARQLASHIGIAYP